MLIKGPGYLHKGTLHTPGDKVSRIALIHENSELQKVMQIFPQISGKRVL
jgi:hypothetical protein